MRLRRPFGDGAEVGRVVRVGVHLARGVEEPARSSAGDDCAGDDDGRGDDEEETDNAFGNQGKCAVEEVGWRRKERAKKKKRGQRVDGERREEEESKPTQPITKIHI